MPKYPHIKIKLAGTDGNAFSVLAVCLAAARGMLTKEEMAAFREEAMASDFDHLIATCCEWFDVR